MTEDNPAPARRGPQLLKGCGCVTSIVVMALGILVIGGFDDAAWASALTATVVGVLVVVLSGTNGMWEK